jgi:hypothetical protein
LRLHGFLACPSAFELATSAMVEYGARCIDTAPSPAVEQCALASIEIGGRMLL